METTLCIKTFLENGGHVSVSHQEGKFRVCARFRSKKSFMSYSGLELDANLTDAIEGAIVKLMVSRATQFDRWYQQTGNKNVDELSPHVDTLAPERVLLFRNHGVAEEIEDDGGPCAKGNEMQ